MIRHRIKVVLILLISVRNKNVQQPRLTREMAKYQPLANACFTRDFRGRDRCIPLATKERYG